MAETGKLFERLPMEKGPPLPPENAKDGLPIIAVDIPIMYEDEGQEEMGEAVYHVRSDEIARNGIKAHLANLRQYRVYSNLNLYYHPVDRWAYVSPDTMVATPEPHVPEELTSYRIGQEGPGPVLALEVLSRRSFQQQDLTTKPIIYAQIGVTEFILVDTTGQFLPQKLLLKRLQKDKSWIDYQDADGGVTSLLGFRLIIDNDGQLRVLDAKIGSGYVRPDEAHIAAKAHQNAEQARRQAEERFRSAEQQIQALQEELSRLKKKSRKKPDGK